MKRALLTLLLCLLAQPVLAAGLKPLLPEAAPALDLPILGGGRIDLPSLKGRVVLVNFWATWCPPCRKEMPSMERLRTALAARPFTIVAVNAGDTPDEIEAFLKQLPVSFPIAMDEDGQQLKGWQAFVFPTSYLVDKQGRIRYGLYGSIEWDAPEAVAIVEGLLQEPATTAAAAP
jgi:thiol-disulfide isomerase/thioredoxin